MKHYIRYSASDPCVGDKAQNGLILIEVLIAGLILVLGMGGLAATQLTALKTFTNAETTSLLVDFHGSVVDRLRLHPVAAGNGDFNIDLSGSTEHHSGESIPNQSSPVGDILVALENTGAEHHLKIQCDSIDPTHCQVCIGLSAATFSVSQPDNGASTLKMLCSRQRIL